MDFDSTKGSRRWHSPQLGRGLLDAFIYTCLKQFQNRRRMDEKKCRWDWEHPTQPNPNRIMRSNTDLDAEFRKGYFKSLCRKHLSVTLSATVKKKEQRAKGLSLLK
jgi:hypothetical protein